MSRGISAFRPILPALGRLMGCLLVLPFVLLSLLAQGTMVVAGPQPQSFMVVLCGDHAPVEMVLDDQGNVVPAAEYRAETDPASKKSKEPCDWSSHAQPMLQLALPALAALADLRPLPLMSEPAQHARRLEVLSPSARGPPTA